MPTHASMTGKDIARWAGEQQSSSIGRRVLSGFSKGYSGVNAKVLCVARIHARG